MSKGALQADNNNNNVIENVKYNIILTTMELKIYIIRSKMVFNQNYMQIAHWQRKV